MKKRPYAGNGKPFIYAQFAPVDRENAEEILSVMRERGYEIWPSERFDRRRMEKSALALFFLSPAAAANERVNLGVSRAAQTNHPMLAVHLAPTELTAAQKLLLNTQQAILRYEFDTEGAFFEKLFGSRMLQNLRVTRAQKRAARLTGFVSGGGMLLAAALAVMFAIGVNAEIPDDSLLAQLGYGGRMNDITNLYVYGQETRDTRGEHTICGTVYNWQKQVWHDMVFFNDADEETEAGDISDISDFAQLRNLEELSVAGNQIADVTPLFRLRKLKYLDIAGNPVSDLSGIGALDALEELNIAGTQVASLLPLNSCASLRKVYVDAAQFALFSDGGETYGFELNEIGPLQDLLHLDTYLIGGAEGSDEPKRPYSVFLRTLTWTIYDEYTYEVFKNGEPIRIDRIENTTIFFGRKNDEVNLLLNGNDFGGYDTGAEYLLVVHYHGASATYEIGHMDDKSRENPMCPELIDFSGF